MKLFQAFSRKGKLENRDQRKKVIKQRVPSPVDYSTLRKILLENIKL